MSVDSAAALAAFSQAIAGEILTMPVLSDPAWDTFALLAEVDDASVGMTAYRYTDGGPPVPTPHPPVYDLFRELRDRTRGAGGETWEIAIVRINRDTAELVTDFVSGDAAEQWRITPANINNLPEKLRPRPDDFQGGGTGGDGASASSPTSPSGPGPEVRAPFEALQPLVTRGSFYAMVAQSLLSDTLDDLLGEYSWEIDLDSGTLTFVSAGSDQRVETRAEMVASLAPGPRSLLWGWAQQVATGDAAQRLRDVGAAEGITVVTQAEVPFETDASGEALGDWVTQASHVVGQAAVGALGRAPYYSAPWRSGTRIVFLLSSPQLPSPRVDETLPRRLIQAAQMSLTTDHRTGIHWLATYAGWNRQWDEGFSVLAVQDSVTGHEAQLRFSPDARLEHVSMSLNPRP